MAMNKARRTANLNNILTYDTLGNSTLIANLTVEGLTGAGFVKADANGLLSVDTAAYTVVTGATNYLTKITAPNTLGQSLVYDNGTSVYVNSTTGVVGYNHAFQVVANAAGGLVVSTTNTASAIGIVNSASGNKTWDISPFNNTLVINESGVNTSMVFHPGGNITVGDITTTGHKFEVVGSFRTTGNNTLSQLSGVGTRMVVVDTNGLLSTQAIATGSVTGTGAAGQVAFWTGTSVQSGSNNLFWDATNSRLGIGTNAPARVLSVTSATDGSAVRIEVPASNLGAYDFYLGNAANTSYIRYNPYLLEFNRNGGASTIRTTGSSNDLLLQSSRNLQLAINAGTIAAQLYSTGNLVLQNGGTFADSGQRLQVTGDTLLKGSGNTNATTALTVQNSDGTNMLRLFNNGLIRLGSSGSGFTMNPTSGTSYGIDLAGTNVTFSSATTTQDASLGRFLFSGAILSRNTDNVISGNIASLSTFAPTAGNGRFFELLLQSTINQTGTANGITRGLYVNPTLTAAADWRSIEWSNNSGWGLYGAGTAPNLLNGNLLIGTTNNFGAIYVQRNSSNAVDQAIIFAQTPLAGNITGTLYNYSSSFINQNAVNTANAIHYRASQGALTTSTIDNQFGFRVDNFTSATNNYGFFGNIAAATGRWNLYMNGTADNYLAGSLGIGTMAATANNVSLMVTRQLDNAGPSAIFSNGQIQSTATLAAIYNLTQANVANATFTLPTLRHYSATQGTFGASAIVTTQVGFHVQSTLTGATNNYAFQGSIASGTGRWNLYMDGTAANYLGGSLTVNSQISAGNAQATAGSVVLRTTYSSGNISNIGTNGSSGGVTISYGAYPASTSTADAFLSGIGFTSFPRSAYAVESDHRWLSAASALVAEGSAVTLTEKMRLYNSGNLVIQNGGTYTDSGDRLQVTGTIKATSTSTATNFLANGTDAVSAFRFQDGQTGIYDMGSSVQFRNWKVAPYQFTYQYGERTSGIRNIIEIPVTVNPTSGTATYSMLVASPTINQTGGANGITRGLYVNPTITAAADWRSIEWSNNSGYGLYGAGTAQNLLNGKLTVNHTVLSANFTNANTMGVFGQQLLNIPAGSQGTSGAVYAASSGFHYFRFNGNTTLVGDALWAASIAVSNIQFDTTGTVTMADGVGGGTRQRALSGMQIQMQTAGNNNGTVTKAAGLLIQGCYPSTGTGVTTFDQFAGIRINDLTEWGTARITMTERWGIYQAGTLDNNYFAGKVNIGTATVGTSPLKVSGLPTSAAGLAAGEVWNNGGVLNIA